MNPVQQSSNSVSLADEDGVKRILAETMLGLWSTVNNLARLTPSKRDRYRVTLFGSARTDPSHWVYQDVRRMTRELAEMGCDIMTGGGPGPDAGCQRRRAGSRGGRADPEHRHPRRPAVRAGGHPFVGQSFEHETFFTRLHQFVLMSDAFIVAPGGIGTVLESTMIWQLLQVRHLHDTPLIFVGKMWQGLVDWASAAMLRPGFELASAEDMKIRFVLKPPTKRLLSFESIRGAGLRRTRVTTETIRRLLGFRWRKLLNG